MAMSAKLEHALLSADEISLLRSSHHPGIYELNRKDLAALQVKLRDLRAKAKTLSRQKQREARGKTAPRGKTFPGTAERPLLRKQLFAAAAKRVNREIARLGKLDAKVRHVEAAQRALAEFRASGFTPAASPSSQTAGTGMSPKESTKRRRTLRRGTVGSVLKQNKVAQAIRDARR